MLFYDEDYDSLHDANQSTSVVEISDCAYLGTPPQLTSPSQLTVGTQTIGHNRYKMMGLATKDEALTQLNSATAVLFHEKQGEERPLLLAVTHNGRRFLLSVTMQQYSNGDRFWGVCSDRRKILVGFRNKETLLQFYAMCPQAAVMSFFDI